MAKLGELSVGSIVKTNVNGTLTNFIVVQQGRPSTSYDSSCNGTWLMMENLYKKMQWYSNATATNNYANSDIHADLNDTFLNLLDSDIMSVVKQVKLPYTQGSGSGGSVQTGASGLSTKVFLLSYTEVGYGQNASANVEGSVLSYFNGAANSKRVAKFNGTASAWGTRSPNIGNTASVIVVTASGGVNYYMGINTSVGIRPAFIMDSSVKIDDNGLIVTSSLTIRGSVIIGGARKEIPEGYVNIGGVWKPVVESYVNIGGVWKPSHE